jgi:hypothetical protein
MGQQRPTVMNSFGRSATLDGVADASIFGSESRTCARRLAAKHCRALCKSRWRQTFRIRTPNTEEKPGLSLI